MNPVKSAVKTKENRIEVIIQSAYYNNYYMFVLLRKGGAWGIDSIKTKGERESASWEKFYY